jgi:uncharacterized RDD family membrane protein YckC
MNDARAHFCGKCGALQPGTPSAGTMDPGLATGTLTHEAFPSGYGTLGPDAPVTGAIPPPALGLPPAEVTRGFRGYAGFWIRVLAALIDGGLLAAVFFPMWFIFAAFLGVLGGFRPRGHGPHMAAVFVLMPAFSLTSICVAWLYEALMTSSAKQATLGKMALGLKVIDTHGNRLTFAHATGRHFAKILNSFTLQIGYLMVGFTQRKQGLHDLITGTYVIKS